MGGGGGDETRCKYKVVTRMYCLRHVRPNSTMCWYMQVEVKTSDVRGAGTDANVTVQAFGLKGDTGQQKL